MAKSVLDIIIRTIKQGGADKETVQGLVNLKGAILNTAGAAGLLIGAGVGIKKALDETVGTLVEYADQVRTVQNATEASAEDASKLIQILDDQKVSYESLEKAIQKSGKAYDFSIAGIAKMSDQYLKLENSQDRAAFMQERFGKQWLEFVPIMQQSGKAILNAADAVDKNLVLTQKAVDAAREYEISIDNLNDSFQGLKITVGQDLLPAINQVLDGFNVYIRAQQIMAENTDKAAHGNMAWKAALEQATLEVANQKLALHDHAAALDGDTQSADDNAKALKEISVAHQSMLGLITNIASETKNYEDRQAELTQKMAENRAEAEKLYPWQKQQLDELNAKYADMQTTYDENAEAHRLAMGKIQYDLFITKLSADGLTDAEFHMAQQAGLMFGVFDQGSVRTAQNMNAVAQAVADGRLRVKDMDAALRLMEKGYTIDIVLNTIQQMTGGWHAQGSAAQQQAGIVSGFQHGGISTGPESGHVELLHGTEAVIPLKNGNVPVQMQGGGGIVVNLMISSPITVLDQQSAKNMLLPFIEAGIREAKARGAI